MLTLNENDYTTANDEGVIRQVISAFNNGTITLPARKYDNREIDVLDNLTIIVQHDSYVDTDNEFLWPHKSISGSNELLSGMYIRNYNILNTYALVGSSMQKQGVITHEFMHSLGFPDLYRYSGGGSPVGVWDIMAGVSMYMQYPLSYMRYVMGWVPMGNANIAGHYTVNAAEAETGDACLKIKTPISDNEFFCIEYRQKLTGTAASLGFETEIPSSGLLIYRVKRGFTTAPGILRMRRLTLITAKPLTVAPTFRQHMPIIQSFILMAQTAA